MIDSDDKSVLVLMPSDMIIETGHPTNILGMEKVIPVSKN
jgi:hypothetical protein